MPPGSCTTGSPSPSPSTATETTLEVAGDHLTYAELDATARRPAGEPVAGRGGVPVRVGLLAARSTAAYAGYLAAQRLGATVVPLNPAFPPTCPPATPPWPPTPAWTW
ncbi:hypothetical protein OIB37_35615 [Streptomyces sp. NBC_00820]|uniref:AMP-binding protein n=1 Tax=Streptomyces sp. NBC_00820 TaxID=2975842 RepID=UPI002ECFB0E4|nr:hypothetical protein OIB37_35615 [Streptomyces sp. NBC_00820]